MDRELTLHAQYKHLEVSLESFSSQKFEISHHRWYRVGVTGLEAGAVSSPSIVLLSPLSWSSDSGSDTQVVPGAGAELTQDPHNYKTYYQNGQM